MATEEKPPNLYYAPGFAPAPTAQPEVVEEEAVQRKPDSTTQPVQQQQTQVQQPLDPAGYQERATELGEQALQKQNERNTQLRQGLSKQESALQQIQDDTRKKLLNYQKAGQKARDDMNAAQKEITAIQKEKINPNRYFQNMSTWNRILSSIAIGASGYVSRQRGRGTNSALALINKHIDDDIKLQVEDKENRLAAAQGRYNHFKLMSESSENDVEALMKTKNFMGAIVAKQLDILHKRTGISSYEEMKFALENKIQKDTTDVYGKYLDGMELQAKLGGGGTDSLETLEKRLKVQKLATEIEENFNVKRSLSSLAPPTGVGLKKGEKIKPLILNTDNRTAQENAQKSINDAREGLMTGQSIKRNFKNYIDAGFWKQFTSGIVSNEASQALSTLKSDVVKLAAKARLATLGGGQLSDQEFRLLRTITTGNPSEEQFSTFINFFKGKQDRFIAVINHMERAIARKYNSDLRSKFSNQGRGYEIGFISRRKGEDPEIDQQSLRAFLQGSRTGEIKR